MAQQRRMIYSSIYANAELNMRPIEERLLYIGTVVLADDDGKMRADPRYLKGQVFPYDENITSSDVEKWLLDLHEFGQIHLYEREGMKILKHPNWLKYQRIRADLHTPSKLPSPPRGRTEPVTAELPNISKDKLNQVKYVNVEAIAPAPSEGMVKKRLEDLPLNWEEYLGVMENDRRLHVQLIAYFFRRRKLKFDTLAEVQEAIARHSKAASKVAKFGKEKVFKAMDECDRMYEQKGIRWTLETCWKLLTK